MEMGRKLSIYAAKGSDTDFKVLRNGAARPFSIGRIFTAKNAK